MNGTGLPGEDCFTTIPVNAAKRPSGKLTLASAVALAARAAPKTREGDPPVRGDDKVVGGAGVTRIAL